MPGKRCGDVTSLESLENNSVGCQSHGDTPLLGTELRHCWLPALHTSHTGALFSSHYLRIWSSCENHLPFQLLLRINPPSLFSPSLQGSNTHSSQEGTNIQARPKHPGETMEGGSKHLSIMHFPGSCMAPPFKTAF